MGTSPLLTMLTGIVAFLLGSISTELLQEAIQEQRELTGIAGVGGFAFFQIIISGILWIWFFVQLSVNFPVMRPYSQHRHNLVFDYDFTGCITCKLSYFPNCCQLGDALGGVILTTVGCFFTYFYWKAVTETRDLHVQEHHVHTDVRIMEEAMAEHSLFAWTVMVVLWVVTLVLNGWSGAHFIADRNVSDYTAYAIHIVTGIMLIYVLMHMLWFPQRMLGDGTRVQTKAAKYADANLMIDGVIVTTEGECPSCGADAPISLNDSGETIVDCQSENCNSRGPSGTTCLGCNTEYPTRYTCIECGVNSPVSSFIPDTEAW